MIKFNSKIFSQISMKCYTFAYNECIIINNNTKEITNVEQLNLGQYIISELNKRGLPKASLSGIAGKHYKTTWAKLEYDRLKAYDLLKIAKTLNLDLNKLKEMV